MWASIFAVLGVMSVLLAAAAFAYRDPVAD